MKKQELSTRRCGRISQTELFTSGEGGYHTYRIPSLIVAPNGVILAVCEARRSSSSDYGDIDLALRRSHDNGATWDRMEIIAADGENTIGNPCPVVDRDTGTIWLPFCRNNDQVYIMKSTDNGSTWSSPVEITEDVKLPTWSDHGTLGGHSYGTGPGHGIQLSDGRLVIPCWHREGTEEHAHVFYSDDLGLHWRLGGVFGDHTSEPALVQTHDGNLYINIRIYRGHKRRAYAWSADGGITWGRVCEDENLVDPDCQGSLARFTEEDCFEKNRVLFSNAASTKRERMTVRVSYDECQSWSVSKVLHEGPSAYSDLCIAPDMTICCLYERGEQHPYETLTLARFDIDWLTNGADSLREDARRR